MIEMHFIVFVKVAAQFSVQVIGWQPSLFLMRKQSRNLVNDLKCSLYLSELNILFSRLLEETV